MGILNRQPRKASRAGLERGAGALRTMAAGALGRARGWVERCPDLPPLSPQLGDPPPSWQKVGLRRAEQMPGEAASLRLGPPSEDTRRLSGHPLHFSHEASGTSGFQPPGARLLESENLNQQRKQFPKLNSSQRHTLHAHSKSTFPKLCPPTQKIQPAF